MDQSNTSVLDIALGRPAMIGFMLLLSTYLLTGQIIPGAF
ncbi:MULTISPECIES: high light inducible protein [Prochlorococcus]|nr:MULTISPECIES: high light inducible protein [Prochlorococcus]KGG14151.1 High light inducible protein hli13 [Prochlorococcus sp. MIT 0601]